MGVVCGDDLDASLFCNTQDVIVYAPLIADAVAHDLKVKVISKNFFILKRDLFCPLVAFSAKFNVTLA